MAKREDNPLQVFPSGFTAIDREYDPRLQVKVRFARTKAVSLWLRDHVLAGIIISVVSLIVGIYIGRWLPPSQPQSQSNNPATISSRKGS